MNIVFVYLSDWCGMYVDGDLKYQSHSVNGFTALQVVKEYMARFSADEPIRIDSISTRTPTDAFETMCEDYGYLPGKLSECIFIEDEEQAA